MAGLTDDEYKRRLGIQPVHVEANRLIDAFHEAKGYEDAGDHARASEINAQALRDLEQRRPWRMVEDARRLARWQIETYRRYYRVLNWRAGWKANLGGDREKE